MSYRQSYRWTVGRSSLRSSRKLVSNERCDCSYCPPAIAETERPCVARTPHPQRRVLRGDGRFRPTADAEPPAPGVGTYLQLRVPHQALGYLTPLEFVNRWKRSVQNQKCH